jgi:hypothetical protein
MAEILEVSDHGLEVLKKAATVPDDTFKSRYAIRVTGQNFSGNFTLSGLSLDQENTVMDIGTTAVPLPASPLVSRNSLAIRNLSLTETLYIGKADVTADTVNGSTSGWQVGPNETYNVDIRDTILVYGVVASGTIKVQIRELA